MAYSITAVPDAPTGRVAVTVAGGVPGEVLYIFRRDSAGVGVVRDTSAATVVWPAHDVSRTNLSTNPSAETALTGWSVLANGTIARTTATAAAGSYVARVTQTAAGDVYTVVGADVPIGAGAVIAASVAVKPSVTRSAGVIVEFYNASNVAIGSGSGAVVSCPTSGFTRLSWTGTTPAGTVKARTLTRWVSGVSGDVIDHDAVLVEAASTIGTYFDGATADTALLDYAWTGTAHASTSTLRGYSSAALGNVVVYDNEARQGEGTDYLLADADGVQLASTRVTVPLWGTWLKSPGRPYLNVRCYLESELPTKRTARRAVVQIEGSVAPVVLSQTRAGVVGALRLLALEGAMSDAVDRLLDDGGTLMLDTDPLWRVPYRYVSVGDVTTERAYWPDRGLELPARVFGFADVVAVEMPIGVSAVDAGRTYESLSTLYASYAALAATVGTYDELATGVS